MQRGVVLYVFTDVQKKHITSTFRVEGRVKEVATANKKQAALRLFLV
jgi:hypothetical protein